MPYNIQVNGITSGLVGAPIDQKSWATATRTCLYSFAPHWPARDVAETILLALDKGGYITNAVLPVDGGSLNPMSSGSSR